MNRARRALVPLAVAAAVLLAPLAPAPADAAPVPAGHLAFVTAAGALKVVAIKSNGNTTEPVKIGPVTKVDEPLVARVRGLVVSADKNWIAWSEGVFRPSKKYGELQTSARIAIRNMRSGKTITLRSSQSPLGFAGSTLVTTGAYNKRLVKQPTPHLVRIPGDSYAVATWAKGIVDVVSTTPDKSKYVQIDRLRLTTFGGHHTLLHTYKVGMQYRSAAANIDAVSPDGRKLIVELGNHQDFEGLGGSSNLDTFAMHGDHARHELGHYGTSKAKWRLVDATFVGARNTPWVAIHSAPKKSNAGDYYVVRGHIVSYSHGEWTMQENQGIAVAGNSAGYVVVQNGEWQAVQNSDAGEYKPVPGGYMQLRGPQDGSLGGHYMKGIKATEMVWVGK
jgi:hypothetical protein